MLVRAKICQGQQLKKKIKENSKQEGFKMCCVSGKNGIQGGCYIKRTSWHTKFTMLKQSSEIWLWDSSQMGNRKKKKS